MNVFLGPHFFGLFLIILEENKHCLLRMFLTVGEVNQAVSFINYEWFFSNTSFVWLTDLREAKVDCVTLGQYMQPTKLHLKVT